LLFSCRIKNELSSLKKARNVTKGEEKDYPPGKAIPSFVAYRELLDEIEGLAKKGESNSEEAPKTQTQILKEKGEERKHIRDVVKEQMEADERERKRVKAEIEKRGQEMEKRAEDRDERKIALFERSCITQEKMAETQQLVVKTVQQIHEAQREDTQRFYTIIEMLAKK
jgi:hypothetical protein